MREIIDIALAEGDIAVHLVQVCHLLGVSNLVPVDVGRQRVLDLIHACCLHEIAASAIGRAFAQRRESPAVTCSSSPLHKDEYSVQRR